MSHIPDAAGESPINWRRRVADDDKMIVYGFQSIRKSLKQYFRKHLKCGCRTKYAKNCSCEKLKLQCLPVCKCKRKPEFDSETSQFYVTKLLWRNTCFRYNHHSLKCS